MSAANMACWKAMNKLEKQEKLVQTNVNANMVRKMRRDHSIQITGYQPLFFRHSFMTGGYLTYSKLIELICNLNRCNLPIHLKWAWAFNEIELPTLAMLL